MVTREVAIADYNLLKQQALKSYLNGKYEKCLCFVESACKIAYQLNFRFSDFELEALLENLSNTLTNKINVTVNPKRYVFYDYFAWDNRGLTQQYIRALISWEVEFLFVIESDVTIQFSTQILKELASYPKATVLIAPKELKNGERISWLVRHISEYGASKAFLHLAPWDVVGVAVWNALKSITRYQINLTDHAFWIGINCIDYVLEFREYGYNLSIMHRGIPEDKLLMMPYYPVESQVEFQGLPEVVNGTVKLFSGGSFYKIYGEKGIFFALIKKILENNLNTVLYFAGDGVRAPFENFIKENKFENRIFLIGNRKDISEIFKNTDIYLGTYPFCGGLMSQFAGFYAKPLVAYTDVKYQCNDVEELFPKLNDDVQLTHKNIQNFLNEVHLLIENKDYRESLGSKLKDGGLTSMEFNLLLNHLVNKKTSSKAIQYATGLFPQQDDYLIEYSELFNTKLQVPEKLNYNIDVKTFSDLYFDTENSFLKMYATNISLSVVKYMMTEQPLFCFRILMGKIRFKMANMKWI